MHDISPCLADVGGVERNSLKTRESSPRLSIPVVNMPPTEIAHVDLVAAVRQQYKSAIPLGDARWSTLDKAFAMAGRLAIRAHPMHLPLDEIVAAGGFGRRNAAASAAFDRYAVSAARAALQASGIDASDVDVVVLETSTVIAMPSPATALARELGLRRNCAAVPIFGMGCRGGAHAITTAYEWLRARPEQIALIVTADFASPHFHLELDLDGAALIGSVVSSTLFSDAAAAAVMSTALADGVELLGTVHDEQPGTSEAIAWVVSDEGLRFRLTPAGVKSIPDIAPALRELLRHNELTVADLATAALHPGGNAIIRDLQRHLELTDQQVAPAWASLTRGNLMSSAILDTIALIAERDELRPAQEAPILGAGFGPGFGTDAFVGRLRVGAAQSSGAATTVAAPAMAAP